MLRLLREFRGSWASFQEASWSIFRPSLWDAKALQPPRFQVLAALVGQSLGQECQQGWAASHVARSVRTCLHVEAWEVQWLLAVVERVLGTLELVGQVADTDTGTEGLVGKAAGTDIGPRGLVGEVGLIHTCRRTGRSHQVADHKICTASSSTLFEIRQRLSLLCLCSSQASLPWTLEW